MTKRNVILAAVAVLAALIAALVGAILVAAHWNPILAVIAVVCTMTFPTVIAFRTVIEETDKDEG